MKAATVPVTERLGGVRSLSVTISPAGPPVGPTQTDAIGCPDPAGAPLRATRLRV